MWVYFNCYITMTVYNIYNSKDFLETRKISSLYAIEKESIHQMLVR